jgi:hypothetical protein
VAALNADVFAAAITVRQRSVGVMTKKARQRMPHPRERAVTGEIPRSTAALTVHLGGAQDVVVDMMPPDRAGIHASSPS